MPDDDPLQPLRTRLAAEAVEDEFPIDDQAIRELHVGLMEALYLDDVPLAESADGDKHRLSAYRDRVSAYKALNTVIRFLQANNKWWEATWPLVRLELALRDLETGYTAPMLRPGAGPGRPVSWQVMTWRGYVAGIMEGLRKHTGMSRQEAAKWVSKKLSEAGHEVAALTVLAWRQDARDHKKHPDLHRAYCVFIDRPDWSNPHDCAERLIAQVIRLTR